MSEHPPPLVPPEVDLRDFPFMPVDIVRLFGSEFHANASDAAWRAGFTLWLKSFHQMPSASIPDDDVALARLAELGRDVKAWKKIKAGALRGWRLCSDGRYYHPVVAEKAIEGWNGKRQRMWRRECDRIRKENKVREKKKIEALEEPPKPADFVLNSAGTRYEIQRIPPESKKVLPEKEVKEPDFPLENALKGKGEGKGKGDFIAAAQLAGGAREKRFEPHDDGPTPYSETRSACVQAIGEGHPADPVFGPIMLLIERGISLREILAVMGSEATSRRERRLKPIRLWSKWAEIVVERLDAAPKVAPPRSEPTEPSVDLGDGIPIAERTIAVILSKNSWPSQWGPAPGYAGCRLPRRLWPASALASESSADAA